MQIYCCQEGYLLGIECSRLTVVCAIHIQNITERTFLIHTVQTKQYNDNEIMIIITHNLFKKWTRNLWQKSSPRWDMFQNAHLNVINKWNTMSRTMQVLLLVATFFMCCLHKEAVFLSDESVIADSDTYSGMSDWTLELTPSTTTITPDRSDFRLSITNTLFQPHYHVIGAKWYAISKLRVHSRNCHNLIPNKILAPL